MQTIELNLANEARAMSDQDLDAVAGGLVAYNGGGGGKVIGGGNFAAKGAEAIIGTIAGVIVIAGLFGL